MGGSSAPSQAPGYWVPVLAVPYASNVGPMNVGWSQSQEPPPPAGVDTVHYFFNLGVEYYRMSSCGQAVGYPQALVCAGPDVDQPLAVTWDPSPGVAPLVRSREPHLNGNVASPPAGNTCVKLISKTAAINLSFNLCEKYAQTMTDDCLLVQGQTVTVDECTTFDCGTVTKCLGDSQQELSVTDGHCLEHMTDDKNITDDKHIREDDDVSEGMDERSDGDSGCPSECADLSSIAGPGSTEMSQCEAADFSQQPDSVNTTRARGKRRYYMYGSHKLVKPIKEIPLRFQILLAETNAAKARCEGQPIYMQQQHSQQPMYDCVFYPTKEGTQPQLNANASCFVPSQDSSLDANISHTYLPECYTLSQVPSYANTLPPGQSSHVTCLQPATMFAPPPSLPAQSTTTQSCQAIIVYSSNSTSSTYSCPQASNQMHAASVPPAPQYPPQLTLPPPPVDQTSAHSTPCLSASVSHISRAVPAHYTQSAVPYSDHFLKTPGTQCQTIATSKPSVVLSVPPPTHSSAVQHNTAAAHHSVAPTNTRRLSTNSHTYLPLPQPAFPPPSNMHGVSGISAQTAAPLHQGSPNSACIVGSTQSVPYHGGVSANQYMYVYQSAPTGPPATPPHVVYMVGPAFPPTQNYQHPAVLFSPTCPVPVQ
ncbi:hypothetical protein BsWGS_17484 [Bradybaena similaris]